MKQEYNVLGEALKPVLKNLSQDSSEWWCSTTDADIGLHTVCCVVTDEFHPGATI